VAQTAFLLGGTGKTGRVLARELASRGWEVRDTPEGPQLTRRA
jgi:nucleoside-diphosphate-sugar epimerase